MAVCNKGITQFYLPPVHKPYLHLLTATRRHHPLAGTYCAYPRRDGQAEWTWVAGWSHTEINVPHRELNTALSPIPVLT